MTTAPLPSEQPRTLPRRWLTPRPTQGEELERDLRRLGVRDPKAMARMAEESIASILRGDDPVGIDEIEATHARLLAQESNAG